MWDFMYEFIESGERFFVECDNMGEAKIILDEYNIKPKEIKFIGKYSVEEAEILGYDTY